MISATAGETIGRERYRLRRCVRYHRLREREESATRATAEGTSLDVEVTQSEREPHDFLPGRRVVIGPVNSVWMSFRT